MKKLIMLTAVVLTVIGGIGIHRSLQKTKRGISHLMLVNIEALTDIEMVGGKPYIVDKIPCSSSAQEVRWDCSYINCGTCESEKGKSKEDNGTCTKVREFRPSN